MPQNSPNKKKQVGSDRYLMTDKDAEKMLEPKYCDIK